MWNTPTSTIPQVYNIFNNIFGSWSGLLALLLGIFFAFWIGYMVIFDFMDEEPEDWEFHESRDDWD